MKSHLAELTVILKHETSRAWLVDHGGDDAVWVPKSQCELEPDANGKTHTLTCPQWLAEDKGLV